VSEEVDFERRWSGVRPIFKPQQICSSGALSRG